MKRIGILTSGGDAPGMNACIRASVRAALAKDIEIFGLREGFAGLMSGDIVPLDRPAIRNIIHLGGTILGTSRAEEFKTIEGRGKAINVLAGKGIEALIMIGGDGTFRGASSLSKEGNIKIVGIPGTIDNDCYGSDYTIGFDTAVNTALEAIDRIRDTADAHQRLFFIEVMGRHSGFIALKSGIASGAEEIIIPEAPLSPEELCRHISGYFGKGKRSIIIVVAEQGHAGTTLELAKQVKCNIGIEGRVCILGHIQRGGPPTARDRVLASTLGIAAVTALLNGKDGHMVGEINGEVAYTPLEDTWNKTKKLDTNLTEMLELLTD